METSVLSCVNPYDVTPISGVPVSVTQEEEEDRGKKVGVKLEMEEFGDLAPFLPESAPKTMANSPVELNTPIFERKGPFDFMVNETTYNITPLAAEDPFKFEYDTIQMGNSVLSSKQLNDFSVSSGSINVQLPESNNNSDIVNFVQGSEATMLFATSESDIYIINRNETPIHAQSEDHISASIFNKIDDNNSVISVNSNENQYSNVSSPSNDYIINTNNEAQHSNVSSPDDECRHKLGIETPEDSNSCTGSEDYLSRVPKLKLSLHIHQQPCILNTPDVIDSVVDLEGSFNILDYVSEKDVTTVNIEDIHFGNPSTPREIKTEIPETHRPSRIRKRTRKYEDDDEDYVPPSKQSTSFKPTLDDSESENSNLEPLTKRGRPPKRTASVSSEHSDASKYRELRDKNNEASRKSRLKRKMKEVTLEREADELEEKNVKLKARVVELEKTVSNFRNDLFKIMLKK